MLSINTTFHPFRLKMNRREPVQLIVEIKNKGIKSKMLSLELMMSKQLSLDKSGLNNCTRRTIEKLVPGASERFYFDIYPKLITQEGELPVIIKVLEHYNNKINFVEKTHTKEMALIVEE